MTAYLTGVQERLRNAELARVEANARADEERKRRLLTVALAASILALVTLGGVAAAWQSQLWQAQLAKVETTLARIQTLRDQAAKDGANSDRWETVLDAADEARGSLGTLAASEPGRRLAALRAKIADDQKRAERDRKLIDELSVTETSVENNSPNLDRRFAEAFERYELDLETTAVKDAIAHLASRPDAFVREVVGGLDRWLVSRHDAIPFGDESQKKQTLLGLHRLLELVKGLDPDQERNRLRALLEQSDLKPHRQVLRAMANQAEVIEFGPSTALLLARILTKAEDEAGAIAVLRAAVIRYPADAWTNFELATLLNRAQPRKLDEAIRYYTVARALRPDSGWDLAQVLQQQGRDDEALALDRELVRRNPKNDGLFMIDLLRLLRKSGRVREAISVAERKIAPLRDRLRREPNNASDHCELGRFLWVLADDRSGAIAEVREAARIEPKDPSNHKSLGLMLLHQGDLPGSIAAYGAAIRVNPSDEELHYNLAWLLERCGDRKGQIAELRAAIRAQSAARNQLQPSTRVRAAVPDEAGLQGQRADPVALDEEHQEAILQESLFSECVKIDLGLYFFPYDLFDSERGQIALGTALAESGDLSGAIGAYLEAIRLGESGRREGKAAPHVYLGSVRRATGDLPGAIASYREAIRLDPEQSIEARYGLGTTLAESRDLPGAIAAFR
ncbi:MAG: tetratricopeptide repeat protein, partial [Isosphaeraceae bacterium]